MGQRMTHSLRKDGAYPLFVVRRVVEQLWIAVYRRTEMRQPINGSDGCARCTIFGRSAIEPTRWSRPFRSFIKRDLFGIGDVLGHESG